ncbi:FxSxx-COOH cyclophane-containing RiPP peptide [Embleya sp. NPDC050493]|uniref:FxSxx-COOH cyclophane-containing RiPP peptide n=1 Tax=Embleya sp. NPDC050493 TaxID=3363989 RepID=UPI003793BBDC
MSPVEEPPTGTQTGAAADDVRSDVLDLSDLTPGDLDALPDTALASALRRVLRDALSDESVFCAFDSAFED